MIFYCWTLQTDPHGHPLYDPEPDHDPGVQGKFTDLGVPCVVFALVVAVIYWYVTNRKERPSKQG